MTKAGSLLKLYCFAYAGGSGYVFRDLAARLENRVDLRPVELPGRGKRRAEACIADWPNATKDLVDSIRCELHRPYALLGYSFGALAALEVAHAICSTRGDRMRRPEALVVCALAGPRSAKQEKLLHRMSDIEMFRSLAELGGVPRELLESPELIELSAPSMRADLTLFETYTPPAKPLNDIPIYVYTGQDDASVGDRYRSWRDETSAVTKERQCPGGHMFIHEDVGALADSLSEDLGAAGYAGVVKSPKLEDLGALAPTRG